MKTIIRRRAASDSRLEVARRCRGGRPYRVPRAGEVPRIPAGLRRTPKELASRFFQLYSGHAMIAPFLCEKFDCVESDTCRWCSGCRQSREHLFKECKMWKEENRTLWKEVGEISGAIDGRELGCVYKGRKGFCFGTRKSQIRPGNCSVGRLMADSRLTEAVLKFLSSTGVGKIKKGVCRQGRGGRLVSVHFGRRISLLFVIVGSPVVAGGLS